jgi:hypothetical protein
MFPTLFSRCFIVLAITSLLTAGPVLAGGQAAPAPSTADVQTVHVPYVRDPVDKSYRRMGTGMQRFERERALAPAATLRFRLLPRLPKARMEGITLRVAGDSLSLPITLDSDLSFVLPHSEAALRQDAAVVANRRSDSMTWRAWVQTPGLAPGTRRLGDLRLECRVGMDAGLISNSSKIFGWLTNALTDTDKICNSFDGNYLFFADRPLFSVTLQAGSRREVLPFKFLYAGGEVDKDSLPFCDCQVLLDRSYYAPLWDASWPDDTILSFEYMDQGATP